MDSIFEGEIKSFASNGTCFRFTLEKTFCHFCKEFASINSIVNPIWAEPPYSPGITFLQTIFGVLQTIFGVLQTIFGVLQTMFGVLQTFVGVLQTIFGVLQTIFVPKTMFYGQIIFFFHFIVLLKS